MKLRCIHCKQNIFHHRNRPSPIAAIRFINSWKQRESYSIFIKLLYHSSSSCIQFLLSNHITVHRKQKSFIPCFDPENFIEPSNLTLSRGRLQIKIETTRTFVDRIRLPIKARQKNDPTWTPARQYFPIYLTGQQSRSVRVFLFTKE